MQCKQAKAIALRLLARREHAVAELRAKLILRKLPNQLIDQVIQAMLDADYLSDQRYAEALIRVRSGKGYGLHYIQSILDGFNIDRQIQETAFSQVSVDWVKVAKDYCKKKPPKNKTKLACKAHLYKRGFDDTSITQYIKSDFFASDAIDVYDD